MSHCPICTKMQAEIGSLTDKGTYVVTCQVCGNFEISEEARTDLRQSLPGKNSRRYLLSAMAKTAPLRSAGRLYVDQKLVDADEGRIPEPRRKEKRESLLRWYADLSEKEGSRYGARVPFVLSRDYPAAYCREAQSPEWHFLFDELKEKYIKMHPEMLGEEKLSITDAGWEFLEEHPSASGAQVFVAMAFDDMDDVWTALSAVKKVIEEIAELSPTEIAELVERFRDLRAVNDQGRRVCRNADLIRFIDRYPPDPEFADDIEAGVRERRARAEDRACPWDP